MKPSFNSEEWLRDFNEFMSTPSTPVPPSLFQKIRDVVYKDLNPSAWMIFVKLIGIHAVVGSLSLLLCAQFGMGPSYGGKVFMSLTMQFGETGCMLFCGALFVGLSLLVGGLVLTLPEVKVLRRTEFLQVLALGILSMGAFLCFGADVVTGLSLFWLMGSLLGGVVMTELSWRLRTKPAFGL